MGTKQLHRRGRVDMRSGRLLCIRSLNARMSRRVLLARCLLLLGIFATLFTFLTVADDPRSGFQSRSSRGLREVVYPSESTEDTPITDNWEESTYSDYFYYDYASDDDSTNNGSLLNSSSFDGFPYYYEDGLRIMFSEVIFFCEYLFSAIHGHYDKLPDSWVTHDNLTLRVIHEPRFVKLCAPLQNYFVGCEEKSPVTLCQKENVTFLQPNICQRPSRQDIHFEKLLVATRLADDDLCFDAVCNGRLRVVETSVGGVLVRFIRSGEAGDSCHRYIHDYFIAPNGEAFAHHSVNMHWPSCFPGFHVLWEKDPVGMGLVPSWDFLPLRCQAAEIVIVTFSVITISLGTVGSFLVVILSSARFPRLQPEDVLKASLTWSDLLVCLFVSLPGLGIHFAKMTEQLEEDRHSFQRGMYTIVVDSGYTLFSAVLFSTCCIASILHIFALSIWDVMQMRGGTWVLGFSHVRRFLAVSWTSSLLITLFLMQDRASSTALWSPFRKLPLGVSQRRISVSFPIILTLLALLTLITLICSLLRLWENMVRQSQTGIVQLSCVTTFRCQIGFVKTLHTALNLITSVMVGIAVIAELVGEEALLLSSVGWWVYLAGRSWDPLLYHFTSEGFRQDAVDLWRKNTCPTKIRLPTSNVLGGARSRVRFNSIDGAERIQEEEV